MNTLFISDIFLNVNDTKDISAKKGFFVQRKSEKQIHKEQKIKRIHRKIAWYQEQKALRALNDSSNELTLTLKNRINHELIPHFKKSSAIYLRQPKPIKQYDEVFYGLEDAQIEQNKIQAHLDKLEKQSALMREFGYFFNLVPDIQLDAVWWRINKIYKGDVKAYVESVPLFTKLFTKTMLHYANATIVVDDSQKRKLKRWKKEMLLYSSQLLQLVGLSAASYINESLLNYYLQDRQEQKDFIENNRLISSSGKFRKLTPMDVREKRKTAQILNVSDTLSQIAQDRDWTFSFVTITLPAAFHPNPQNGHNTFNGELPSKAHKRIQRFWQRIRAYLARYGMAAFDDYMGAMTSEVHKDSTIHLHCIIYHSRANALLVNKACVAVAHNGEKKRNKSLRCKDKYQALLDECDSKIQKFNDLLSLRRTKGLAFCGVDQNLNKKIANQEIKKECYLSAMLFFEKKADHEKAEYNVNFKFISSNGKAKGSTYLFKYIMKTTGNDSSNSNATKNAAARWYYSAHAFSFFGVENSLSKFNFIIENKEKYKGLFSDHLNQCLKTHDYYTFLNTYTKFFEVERNQDGAIIFVKYDMSGNNAGLESFGLKPTADYDRQFVLIEKNIYNIVEMSLDVRNIRQLNQDEAENAEIFKAFDSVCQKQINYDNFLEQYKMKTQGKFVTLAPNHFFTMDSDSGMVENSVFDDLEYFDEECQESFKRNALELATLRNNLSLDIKVTVDQSDSSKNKASKLAIRDLQRLRRENKVEYDKIIQRKHQTWLESRNKPITTKHVVSQTSLVIQAAPKKTLKFGLSK